MKNTKKLSLSALLVGLSVVVLYLGSISGLLDMATAAVAAVAIMFVTYEMGLVYGLSVYVATSIISLLILPEKTAAVCYGLFFGLHVLLIPAFQKLNKKISYAIRIVLMNVEMLLITLVFTKIFEMPDQAWMKYVLIGTANIVFILCDILYKKLIVIYEIKIRKKISKFFH